MAHAKSLDLQIMDYLSQLSDKKKKVVLTVVKTFAEETPTTWDIMPEEVKEGVERGLEQSRKGLGKPHDQVMQQYDKWLKK